MAVLLWLAKNLFDRLETSLSKSQIAVGATERLPPTLANPLGSDFQMFGTDCRRFREWATKTCRQDEVIEQ
jgi:hypothetical protein